MNLEEDISKIRGETMERLAFGVGMLANGLRSLSGAVDGLAGVMDGLVEVLASKAVDEEFGEDAEDVEEDFDEEFEQNAKDVEDDELEDDVPMYDQAPPPWPERSWPESRTEEEKQSDPMRGYDPLS